MSKLKITGKVLSVRLGRDETQIALLRGSELIHAAVVTTPAGAVEDGNIRNAEAVREMLKTALKDREFKHIRQVVFALCTSQVVTETVTVPDIPASKLEKLIQANLDMYFPMDMKEYQVVWQTIGPKQKDEDGVKELLVQLWAVPSAMIARYYHVANACNLSVAAIDYCGNSIASAVGASFAHSTKTAKKKISLGMTLGKKKAEAAEESTGSAVATEVRKVPSTDLHLYLEKDLLGMTFVQEGRVVLQRFIRCGSEPAHQFGEIAMMVEYFCSLDSGRGSYINGIVSGTLAYDEALVAELDEILSIPLIRLTDSVDPKWMICVGAARTTMDFGTPALNRPGKVRKEFQSQIWQYALVLAGGLAVVAVIFLTLSSRLVWNIDISRLETSRQTLSIQAQTVAGYADNYKKYSSLYDSYKSDWETIFSSLRTNNDNLVLALKELEDILPENTSVTALQISPDGLTVQFASENKEEAAYLIMALRELRYADLTAISNLSGGGGGAAESYGSGSKEEAPPTEGSNNGDAAQTAENTQPADNQAALKALIKSELSEEEVIAVYNELTDEQIALLEQNYGAVPQLQVEGEEVPAGPVIHYESLAALKKDKEGTLSDGHCAAAIRTMLTANPITMNRFADMLEEDFWRDKESYLWQYIQEDVVRLQKEGAFGEGSANDAATMLKYMDILADVCTKDSETIAATEALFCTDPVMEKWYIFYLEAELAAWQAQQDGLPAPEVDRYAFLDLQKVLEDVMDGGFDTGDEDLDAKLDGLLSDEAWTMIEGLGTEDGVTDLMNQYLTTGTTGNIYVDAVVKQYLETGTTGSAKLDDFIDSYMNNQGGGEVMDQNKLNELLNQYLTTGTTGNALYDALIDQYLTTGSTGNSAMDEMIDNYIAENFTEESVLGMLNGYLNEGTTGNPAYDTLIDRYLTGGTTGSPAIDGWIDSFISNNFTEDKVVELLTNYFETGSTGDAIFDGLINGYLANGTTGNEKVDAWIEDYIREKLEGDSAIKDLTKEKMTELMMKYLTTGTTGNIMLDALIETYASTGTTGNETLDKLIEEYIAEFFTEDMVAAIVEKYLTEGTTGSTFLDNLILKYLTEGTTGNAALDKMIDEYIDKMISGFTMEELVQMINKFKTTGSTGNKMYDALLNKYIKTGTTGIAQLDEWLKLYESLFGPLGGSTGGSTGGNTGGSTGGSTGGTTAPTDTRVYFTVSLAYSEALKNAELDRESLNDEDMIEKLEVGD